MTGTMTPIERLNDRFARFRTFVNEAMDLRLVASSYRLRLTQDGLTEHEKTVTTKDAIAWLVDGPGVIRAEFHAVVTFWAALEVLMEDVFAEVCSCIDITSIERLAKVRISIAEFSQLSEMERYRLLWDRIETKSGEAAVERWDDIFGLLGMKVDVSVLEPIAQWHTPDNKTMREVLREFQQVRNVIMHRGEIVDRRLEKFSREATFKTGETLVLSSALVDEYGMAGIDYGAAAVAAAVQIAETASS